MNKITFNPCKWSDTSIVLFFATLHEDTGKMSYRILIVEDEYWTARDLVAEAQDRGVDVTGPTSSVPQAIKLLKDTFPPDAAILDVQLRADEVFPLADILLAADIPFLFATGYEKHELPARFSDVPHLVKPFASGACIEAALALVDARLPVEP